MFHWKKIMLPLKRSMGEKYHMSFPHPRIPPDLRISLPLVVCLPPLLPRNLDCRVTEQVVEEMQLVARDPLPFLACGRNAGAGVELTEGRGWRWRVRGAHVWREGEELDSFRGQKIGRKSGRSWTHVVGSGCRPVRELKEKEGRDMAGRETRKGVDVPSSTADERRVGPTNM